MASPALRVLQSWGRWPLLLACIHALVAIVVLSVALPDLSSTLRAGCHNSRSCSARLSRGASWLLPSAKQQDISDPQWRSLRSNAGALIGGACVFLVASHTFRLISSSRTGAAVPLFRARPTFYAAVGVGVATYLHGPAVLVLLLLVLLGYGVSWVASRPYLATCRVGGIVSFGSCLIWGACLLAMVLVEWRRTWFRFHVVFPPLQHLDSMNGPYSWCSAFNLVLLRVLSFSLERCWHTLEHSACQSGALYAPATGREAQLNQSRGSFSRGGASKREQAESQPNDYGLIPFVGYVFYTPLYLAGPIMPYHSWLHHVGQSSEHSVPTKRSILVYAATWLSAAVLFEWWLHWFPVYAIVGSKTLWRRRFSLGQLLAFAYVAVHTLWLKFYVVWRFFRLWSLLDGVDCPENMLRCIDTSSRSLSDFWRSWHSSFNQWLVRYLYIPLGGSRKHRVLNVWVVFTFVALWHDMNWTLLTWAWLLALGFALWPASAHKEGATPTTPRQPRFLVQLRFHAPFQLAALSSAVLTLANFIGFFVGASGTWKLIQSIPRRSSMWDGLSVAVTWTFLLCVHYFAHYALLMRGRERQSRRE